MPGIESDNQFNLPSKSVTWAGMENEAPRGEEICPSSTSLQMASLGREPGFDSEVHGPPRLPVCSQWERGSEAGLSALLP